MADNNENSGSAASRALPWYDYQPGVPVPKHITHMRVGVQQALVAAQKGTAPEIMELPNQLCRQHSNLQQVQIHVHTVEVTPSYAFGQCQQLKQVEFVASTTGQSDIAEATRNRPVQPRLTMIDYKAFYYCPNLHSVIGLEHVSQSLKRIGISAFGKCGKLTTLNLSCLTRLDSLGNAAFAYWESLTVVDLSNSLLVETINSYTFCDCKALCNIHLPRKLKQIHFGAFQPCKTLVSIVIPALVETMSHLVFGGCSSLTQVTFQSTRHLRRLMNNQQFYGCTSLHTLELQGSAIPRTLWPLLLEHLLRKGKGISSTLADIPTDRRVSARVRYARVLARSQLEQRVVRAGILTTAGISESKQCITIAWNFVRNNIANFYLEEEKKKPVYRRKRNRKGL